MSAALAARPARTRAAAGRAASTPPRIHLTGADTYQLYLAAQHRVREWAEASVVTAPDPANVHSPWTVLISEESGAGQWMIGHESVLDGLRRIVADPRTADNPLGVRFGGHLIGDGPAHVAAIVTALSRRTALRHVQALTEAALDGIVQVACFGRVEF